MTIAQLQVTWSGLTGLPGYSFFYVRSTAASIGPIPVFLDAIKTYFPAPLTWNVNPVWKLLDETNGKMTGVGGGGAQPAIAAQGSTSYASAQGAQIKWGTNGFNRGRRVWGRTYLVPLIQAAHGAGGLITSTTVGTINSAAEVMRQAYTGNMVVWSRPVFEKDADGKPTDVVKYPGTIYDIVSTTTPTKSVVLTRRRDV